MRICTAAALGLVLIATAVGAEAVAAPDDSQDIAGDYSLTFEPIADNCSGSGMTLRRGVLTLAAKGDDNLEATLPGVATMNGRIVKGGKFRAKAKLGGTAIQGLLGKFSVAGRVTGKKVQLVFIAEFYKGNRRSPEPVCTQSWNASGARSR